MNQFVLTPYKSVGLINMGEQRKSVRMAFPKYSEFRKNRFSKNTTDDFKFFHVFYDLNNCVEAVEFFPGVDIMLNSQIITNMSINELIDYISDTNIIKDDYGINFPSVGLSVTISENKIESYLCYFHGYWD